MEDGVNSVIGKNAQSPVEAPSIVDTVNVTTLRQHMVGKIALLMAQLTSKQRDVMKIHAQVSTINKHTNFDRLPFSRFFHVLHNHHFMFHEISNTFVIHKNISKWRMGRIWRLGGMSSFVWRRRAQ